MPPAAAVKGALPPARSSQLALPPASVTPQSSALVRTTPAPVPGQKALPPGQGQAFNPEVKAQTRVLETVDLNQTVPDSMRGKTGMVDQVSVDENFRGKNSYLNGWLVVITPLLMKHHKQTNVTGARCYCKTTNSCNSKNTNT